VFKLREQIILLSIFLHMNSNVSFINSLTSNYFIASSTFESNLCVTGVRGILLIFSLNGVIL